MKDKFTTIFESIMKSLDEKRGKLVAESYIEDLFKQEEERQREFEEKKKKRRERYRTIPLYKSYIEKVNLVYKNLDKLLVPWVDKPFVGFEELKYPGIKSHASILTYHQMICDLSRIASMNKWDDFLDISQDELESMIIKLKENPYYKLAREADFAANSVYVSEENAEKVKKLYDDVDPKPKWVDFEKIERNVAKQKARINEYEERQRKVDEEYKKLKEWAKNVKIDDKIREQYFKDYGYMNTWNKETYNKWEIAKILHARDLHDHPELHTRLIEHPDPSQRGINNYIACDKCALKASWDSSD